MRRRVARRSRSVCGTCGTVAYRNPIPGARAIVEREGLVLFALHARGWDTPGGYLEEGEDLLSCLAREVREETGLRVAPTGFVGVYNHAAGRGRVLNLYFRARVTGGRERPGDDVRELGWFSARLLPALAHPEDNARVLADWRRGRGAIPLLRRGPAVRAGPRDRFCARCGGRLVRQVCGDCGAIAYRNPKPCAGALVERDGKVMLVRRAVVPYRGWWDIPGGFLEAYEHPREAAVREVREETGLRVNAFRLLGIYLDRYGSTRTLNLYYRARAVGGRERPGDDAAEVGWFGPRELPSRVAYPFHARLALADWAEAASKRVQES